LYVAPFLWWLVASARGTPSMPSDGHINRQLVVCLWLVLTAQVVVNNYSNMRVVFGLGIWWLTLGLIASVVTRFAPRPDEGTSSARPAMASVRSWVRAPSMAGRP
jgi:hypothetical protein